MGHAAAMAKLYDNPATANDAEGQWSELNRVLSSELVQTSSLPRRITVVCDDRLVVVEYVCGDPAAWLIIRTPVCSRDEMDPALTLERNATLAFAALLLSGAAYWLRVAIPFDSADLMYPVRLIKQTVSAARSLAPRHVIVADDASRIFSCYAD